MSLLERMGGEAARAALPPIVCELIEQLDDLVAERNAALAELSEGIQARLDSMEERLGWCECQAETTDSMVTARLDRLNLAAEKMLRHLP